MNEIKVTSGPLVKGEKMIGDSGKRYVRNMKSVQFERDHKPWAPNDLIEVDKEEAIQLHHEGHLVLDEDDLEAEKEAAKEKLELESKEGEVK